MRNDTHAAQMTPDPDIVMATETVDKFISPILYLFGFPGNIMSCIVWLQPRMRHSSGTYLAALGFADLLFLVIHVLFELYKVWGIPMFDAPVICEVIPIMSMATQYLSPLLVLAFTVERFIGVCLPNKRQTYCTISRAQIVSLGLAVFSLALGSMQGYFYVYNPEHEFCSIRAAAVHGGTTSIWSIWTWITEMLIFLFVPLLILIFNLLIIKEVKRLAEFESSCKSRAQTTTFSLLIVSFYFIVTTFPVSIVYATRYYFIPSEETVVRDVNVRAKYMLAKTVIEEIGITHFACKFYIFLLAERVFRDECINVVRKVLSYRQKKNMGYVQQTEATARTEWNDTEMTASANPEETDM